MYDLQQPHCFGPAGVKGWRSGASLWGSDVEVCCAGSVEQTSGATPTSFFETQTSPATP